MRSHLFQPKTSDTTARYAAPDPLTTTERFDWFRVLLGTLFFLVVTSFLTSAKLVEIADRMEFGPERDRWLRSAQIVHEASGTLYLDRPGQWIRSAVTYDDGPNSDEVEVVVGDLLALPLEKIDQGLGPEEPAGIQTPPVTEPVAESDPSAEPDPASDPEAVSEPEPEPEPEPVIPPLREITETEPLRMWMGGDSLGQFVAGHVAYRIAPPERTDIAIDYHISTGLARPDYFDWPGRLTAVMADEATRPEAVVYMVGGNDDQAMRLQSAVLEVSTPEWQEEYTRRVGLVMDVTAYADTRMLWVLLPPMEEERRELISNDINRIVTEQAARRPWVSVIDIDDLFIDEAGQYARFIDDPNGEQQLARQADGVHVTEIGSRWVADRLWGEVTDLWNTVETPAEPEPVLEAPTEADSAPTAVSPEE